MNKEQLISKITQIASKVINQTRISPLTGEKYIEKEENIKFPQIKDIITILFTEHHYLFIDDIKWVSPRPTTFKIILKNQHYFFLIYNKKSWIAQIEGKKYYLLNLPEEERAVESITRILSYSPPPSEDTLTNYNQPPDFTPPDESLPQEEPTTP
jgi:hypothetical protein